MKFETIEKMEAIIKKTQIVVCGESETAWDTLVVKKVFSRGVPIPREDKSYEGDWCKIFEHQMSFLKEFVASSIRFGLGIPPLNEEGSLISKAVYNAAINASIVEDGILCIPSTYDICQEFENLLMETDI